MSSLLLISAIQGVKYLAFAKNVDRCVWSCSVVPVNVGNPRTVDAVENNVDAD